MTNMPKKGGEVYKIVGQSTSFMDARYDLSKQSDVDAFAENEKEAKRRIIEKMRKQQGKN